MDISIEKSKLRPSQTIQITGSKSESNRLLVLKAFFPSLRILNLSNSDDTQLIQRALESRSNSIDIHHAGTAMRFLTAYFAIQQGREVIITGSSRMKERPIKILVDALKDLGADIHYLENEGFPPLKIKGKEFSAREVTLKANVSSQYISALLLIGSQLKEGISIHLDGEITSLPYIRMTLALLDQTGIASSFEDQTIDVYPYKGPIQDTTIEVESDWSSASYYYSMVALSEIGTSLSLKSYKLRSLQGDAVLSEIYNHFGVQTDFTDSTIRLTKINHSGQDSIELDLKNAPDIAQTIAVTAFGLGISIKIIGLHTLKIKETDRLLALKNELEKLGAHITVTSNSLALKARRHIESNVKIATYNDHRMAMAFTPLALKTSIVIQDAMVVSKSYPTFWEDLKSIGFVLK